MNSLKKAGFRSAAIGFALAFVFSAHSLRAQQPDQDGAGAPQANPDTRAVRLSDVEGAVQLTQGSQILAEPALANTPLFQGTVVNTKEDGRAELQFDDGSVVRISPNSSLKLTVLKHQGNSAVAEVVLQSGLAYLELQGDTSTNRMVARFGDSAVSATGFAVLRIDMDNPPGELAVFSGNAHLERGNALSLDLHGGESVALSASDPNQYNLAETIEPNSWDAWNADRDQDLNSEQAAKTAASGSQPNSNNPAWADLDANGNWYDVPGQGYVWSPYESAQGDWDPYGCGSWVWNPQFGYSWVSCESWGYLPYASGYWDYYDGFGWGWTPGFGYPWWVTGGWGFNIGRMPTRYQPPHRPHGGPVHPPAGPIRRGGFYQPNPVIAVNRIPRTPSATPAHVVGNAVTIAGATVVPMRPLSPRPVYNHTASRSAFEGQGTPSYGYPIHSGYAPLAGSGGAYGRSGGSWPAPIAPGGGYHPPAAGPYSGGGNHIYSGGPVHPGTGGGGGGSHPSGGGGGGHPGGGGGGGGAHPSAGGGGGGGGSHASSSGGHH